MSHLSYRKCYTKREKNKTDSQLNKSRNFSAQFLTIADFELTQILKISFKLLEL